MSEPIVLVDCSEIREGKLVELKTAISAMGELIPRLTDVLKRDHWVTRSPRRLATAATVGL
jgi:hypothetical protein